MTTPTNRPDRWSRGAAGASGAQRAQTPSLSIFSGRSSIGPRTYCFESKLRLFPGVTIPLRSMLATTSEQQLLISPLCTAEEASHIGTAPLALIAPSLRHHLHLTTAIARYRPVALWGPPGLAERKPELGRVYMFGIDAWPYDDQLEFVIINGAPKRNEVVLFHRASRTIYTADLFSHIREPEGWLAPLAFRMMGIHRRFATAKLWRRWVTDRAAFARSIDEILAWDFDRIVVAHGEVIEHYARARFEAALREVHLFA